MKIREHLLVVLFCLPFAIYAQKDKNNVKDINKDKAKKTGYNAGILPAITFSTDLGFQYGALANMYYYGSGENYPKYEHSVYAEISRYTKGSGIYKLFYDSEFLIPNIRTTFEIAYIPDQALDFYGFNGYDAVYNKNFIDETSTDYKTRLFYNHQRNTLSLNMDFQGRLTDEFPLKWVGGFNFKKVSVSSLPLDRLNKGTKESKLLPDVNSLYDDFVDWGVISPKEAKGGNHYSIKGGLIYDTRDNEPCPNSGIWSEIVLSNSYSKDFNFGKISLTHRQYFPIIDNDLNFVYRVGYQGIIYGKAPFYSLPNMLFAYMSTSVLDGLGGSKTVRGMLRNRTVGKDVAFANVELRYKFARFNFIGQQWYMAVNPFVDAGGVLRKIKIDKSNIPSTVNQTLYFADAKESIHLTYGCGLHIAMNENFVVAADFAFPINKNDGNLGIYIGLNWIF